MNPVMNISDNFFRINPGTYHEDPVVLATAGEHISFGVLVRREALLVELTYNRIDAIGFFEHFAEFAHAISTFSNQHNRSAGPGDLFRHRHTLLCLVQVDIFGIASGACKHDIVGLAEFANPGFLADSDPGHVSRFQVAGNSFHHLAAMVLHHVHDEVHSRQPGSGNGLLMKCIVLDDAEDGVGRTNGERVVCPQGLQTSRSPGTTAFRPPPNPAD